MRGKFLSGLAAAVLLLTYALTGCGPSEDLEPSPDGSRPAYFSETHSIDPYNHDVLCIVTVDRVLDGLYDDCLVLRTTVEEVFGASPGVEFTAGDEAALWVETDDLYPFTTIPQEEFEQSVQTLRDILSGADALIIYAVNEERPILSDSELFEAWTADTPGIAYGVIPSGEGQCRLDRPGIRVQGLRGWDILPIKDGVLDAAPIEELIDAAGTEMFLSLEEEAPWGKQYFKNGDLAEDVYEAMRKYVAELK